MKFVFEIDVDQGKMFKVATVATILTMAAKQLLEVAPSWADIRQPLDENPEKDEAVFMESFDKGPEGLSKDSDVMAIRMSVQRAPFDTRCRMYDNAGGQITTQDAMVTVNPDGSSEVCLGEAIEISKH